jgi:hypothetical protein
MRRLDMRVIYIMSNNLLLILTSAALLLLTSRRPHLFVYKLRRLESKAPSRKRNYEQYVFIYWK